jgi:hypothetical protein
VSDEDLFDGGPDQEPIEEEPSSNLGAILVGLVGLLALCGFCLYYLRLDRARVESARERETSVVDHLQRIGVAQKRFAAADFDRNGTPDFSDDLEELLVHISPALARSYFFETGALGEGGWYAAADPREPGMRCFYLDHQGVVYVSARPIEGPLDALSLPVGVTPLGP